MQSKGLWISGQLTLRHRQNRPSTASGKTETPRRTASRQHDTQELREIKAYPAIIADRCKRLADQCAYLSQWNYKITHTTR